MSSALPIIFCSCGLLIVTYHIILVTADGILLKEVNRVLRPNGYFVYSAPPAYRKDKDYPLIWDKLVKLTTAMCWKLIARKIQTAIWIKEENQSCLQHNVDMKLIDVCDTVDDFKPSWNTPLGNCMHIRSAQTTAQKLPPRPKRLSVYSDSLSRIGLCVKYAFELKELDFLYASYMFLICSLCISMNY